MLQPSFRRVAYLCIRDRERATNSFHLADIAVSRPQDRREEYLSYYHKRNFTVHLAIPSTPNANSISLPGVGGVGADLRDATDRNAPKPVNRRITDPTNIICAVNTMGQQRYRLSSYNGWCWDGVTTRPQWKGLIQQIYYYALVTPCLLPLFL